MKRIVGIVILLCLVFLNVPRQFVHSCNDHARETHNKFSDGEDCSDQSVITETGEDECFYCNFDLGYFSTSEVLTLNTTLDFVAETTDLSYEFVSSNLNSPSQLRGPPSLA